jgi:2'-5' RNA ligase
VAEYSALVVPVPEAEEVVGRYRRLLDPAARDGMPAHVTVVAPFAPPSEIDGPLVARLAAVLGELGAFDFALCDVGWFDRKVTFLVPEPALPFVNMTTLVTSAFPSYLPYGGEFAEVVPHLTIGEAAHPFRLRHAAQRVRHRLPIRSCATEVWLMTINDEWARWRQLHVFCLDGTGATLSSGDQVTPATELPD